MSGSLHIFRREIATGLPCFQVNYNLAGRTFAKVFEGDHQLNEFLEVTAALPARLIEDAWEQLNSSGSANIVDVHIRQASAVENDMKAAPTDF